MNKIIKEEFKNSIGEFKPKRKFINFISVVNSARVRLTSKTAFVKGKQLSGVLEDILFKITICDEGTINFEEVETTSCDKEMIKRLIDDIDSAKVIGYSEKFVVSGIEFYIDNMKCYLEVEHKQPIDVLRSLLDDVDEVKEEVKELSAKGMSFLDQLFGSDDDKLSEKDSKILVDGIENPDEPNEALKEAAAKWVDKIINLANEEEKPLSHMEQEFKRLNDEKIEELKNKVERKEDEIKKYNLNLKNIEVSIEKAKKDLDDLKNRLELIYSGDEPNGFVFYVSEAKKRTDIVMDDNIKVVVSKIGKLMGIKEKVLFDFLTGVFYNIKIARKNDFENTSIDVNIIDKVKTIDINAKLAQVDINEFEYRGELGWHELVNKMIRKGFEQDPEFNKLCLSNSYISSEEENTGKNQ